MAETNKPSIFSNIKDIYNRAIDAVFAIILLFITLTMVIGVVRLFYRVGELFNQGGITGSYLYIFADVLTLFILIELSRSLMEYFETHQMHLTPIIDAGIVFVLRHIMIDLFNHKLVTSDIYALSVLLLALAAIRFSTSVTITFNRKELSAKNLSE
ncbi:MAG: phosphate-starvation-inducible PsiE family protein [Gammaproteobacteria bacterium]|nr:phosphate-starvation-inducible PsiE family protein [Gammaproteobacteria bacterium]MCW8986565.1 phosphate-starvation-inducible PsiE family protein [Gammaproteobacteria bacterium]MCW9031974.1 phosphate-starvation-inducible PsiE family protein [Gammaproteobacteria bacterium]